MKEFACSVKLNSHLQNISSSRAFQHIYGMTIFALFLFLFFLLLFFFIIIIIFFLVVVCLEREITVVLEVVGGSERELTIEVRKEITVQASCGM